MYRCTQLTGPRRRDLVKRIFKELEKHSEGIWIRKLARILDEPVMTVHKYVTRNGNGYPGEKIEIVQKLPQELGGHVMIKLKKVRK